MSKKSFLSIEDILSSPSAGQIDNIQTSRMTINDEQSRSPSESNSPLGHNMQNNIVSKLIQLEETKNLQSQFSGINIPGASSALATNLNALMEAVSAVGPAGICQKLSPVGSDVSPNLTDTACHGEPITPTTADHHLSLLWNSSKTGTGGNPDMTSSLSPERHPNFLLSLQRKQQSKRELNSRRQRTSFTAEQTIKLELEFQMNEYITRSRRFELADLLGLSENQIKIWYQNRRAKDKRIEKAHLESNIRRQLNQLAFGGSNPFGLLPSTANPVSTFAEELHVLDRLVNSESLAAEKFQLMANLQMQSKPTLVQSITANNHMTAKSMLENTLSFL